MATITPTTQRMRHSISSPREMGQGARAAEEAGADLGELFGHQLLHERIVLGVRPPHELRHDDATVAERLDRFQIRQEEGAQERVHRHRSTAGFRTAASRSSIRRRFNGAMYRSSTARSSASFEPKW